MGVQFPQRWLHLGMQACRSIFKAGLLAGKTAVVTGGGTGIGKAIATELATLGCKVVIAARNVDRLASTCKDFNSNKPNPQVPDMMYQGCNIRKEDEVKRMIGFAVEKTGRLDFLVNNGGGQFAALLEGISLKGWNAVIETNLTGTFLCLREAFLQWMKENGGSVVNITVETHTGYPYVGHSAAARAGIINLTMTLAQEWAHYGVRLNCVTPGVVYSETAVKNYGETGAAMFLNSIPDIPAKRLGSPEEVSAAVCFLLSTAAQYVTGQNWFVDGGMHLYRHPIFSIPDHDKIQAFTWDNRSLPKSKL